MDRSWTRGRKERKRKKEQLKVETCDVDLFDVSTNTFSSVCFVTIPLRRGGHRRRATAAGSGQGRVNLLVKHNQVCFLLLLPLLSSSLFFLLPLLLIEIVIVFVAFLAVAVRPKSGLLQLELPRVVLVEASLFLFLEGEKERRKGTVGGGGADEEKK